MSKFYEVYSNNEFLSAVLREIAGQALKIIKVCKEILSALLREMSLAKSMLILSNCDISEGYEILLKPFRHKVPMPGEPEVTIGSRMFDPAIADGKKLSALLREMVGKTLKIIKICNEILSALLREINHPNNMLILSNCDSSEGCELLLKPLRSKVYRSGEPERKVDIRTFDPAIADGKKLSAVLREMSLAKNMLILSNCDISEGYELLLKPFRYKVYRPGEPEVPIGSRMFEPEIEDGKKLSALLRETTLKKGCLFLQNPYLQRVARMHNCHMEFLSALLREISAEPGRI